MGKEDTRRLKQIMTLPGAFVFGFVEVEEWKGD